MKLFSLSIGLLLAALGVFYVPVSFSVDGFGLVVNPGGVRTIRATEDGVVHHFASDGGQFRPGQIVSGVTYPDAAAKNALLLGTMQAELSKIESDFTEKTTKIRAAMDRNIAKRRATAERLEARNQLIADTAEVLVALQEFTSESVSDISSLNEERLSQLSRLEDLVKRSGEVSALPAQKLATMLEDIQSDRLSVITSKGTTFSSDKMILDMIKGQNDLIYSNSIDRSEVEILSKEVADQELQIRELTVLRDNQRAESEATYLAKAVLPQVAVASVASTDMRVLQASRADVARTDALRLLATGTAVPSLSFILYGAPDTGEIVIRHEGREARIALPVDTEAMANSLGAIGLEVADVTRDAQVMGGQQIVSLFATLVSTPARRPELVAMRARDAMGRPVPITADVTLPDPGDDPRQTGDHQEIIGFLENRHAVVLRLGQAVRGAISNTRTGSEIVFEARLLERDFSTVDTRELGVRLGNQSLADKIIKRGVLSQVVVEVSDSSAERISHLPGAVVHLSFPLGRQTLFSFLMAKNAAI